MKVKAAGKKRFQEWTDRGGREGANRDREKGEERGGGQKSTVSQTREEVVAVQLCCWEIVVCSGSFCPSACLPLQLPITMPACLPACLPACA